MPSEPNSPEILTTQILGNVFIACIVLSNVPYFYKIEKTRDVGQFNIYPFVFMIGQAMMWVVYSMICNIEGIVPVNTFGMLFDLAFILIFISACKDLAVKRKVMISLMIELIVLVSFVAIVVFQAPKDMHQTILGWATSILLVAFFFSPVLNFYSMFKKRTTGSLSLPLSVTSILAGVAFGLYGVFLEDNFITVSNFSGCVSGIIQIIFYYIMKLVIRISPPKLESQNIYNDNVDKDEKHCYHHPSQELLLFCEDCKEKACYSCVVNKKNHRGHNLDLLEINDIEINNKEKEKEKKEKEEKEKEEKENQIKNEQKNNDFELDVESNV
ncbi:hypothetical protein RB653_008230 [Dictyostelium firmibasis]|uniref:B box-type domain-containing protein n=1 Tax=Dictyostelium firmibasis TaxID=79012 RepID=A0AAN7TZR4_9MYCE